MALLLSINFLIRRRSVSTTAVAGPNLRLYIPPYCFAHSQYLAKYQLRPSFSRSLNHVRNWALVLYVGSGLRDLVEIPNDRQRRWSCMVDEHQQISRTQQLIQSACSCMSTYLEGNTFLCCPQRDKHISRSRTRGQSLLIAKRAGKA
jgi:hypothetical protein